MPSRIQELDESLPEGIGLIYDGDEPVGFTFPIESGNLTVEDWERIDELLTAVGLSPLTDESGNMPDMSALAEIEPQPLAESQPVREPWSGILALEGSPTRDGRIVVPGKVSWRELPIPFRYQPADVGGHDGARSAGCIEAITRIPLAQFDKGGDLDLERYLKNAHPNAIVIWGEGTLDGSEDAGHMKRLIANGAGVSLDGLHFTGGVFDADTLTEVDLMAIETDNIEMHIFEMLQEGKYLQALAGEITGATVVDAAAFAETKVMITASGTLQVVTPEIRALVAAAGPLKPPRDWFRNPHFTELTPLQITKEGRVYGHLCDWDGCHVGFQGICVPPFRSPSGYANFNVGEIECAEGDLIPCGKLMFSRDGVGHAPLTEEITVAEVRAHYDDATCVGAFVTAGEDRFGTWLAGSLRADLNDLEIQHLRTHPPSGDWRPVKGQNDLLAAIAVPIPGFPIRRALVASADGVISGIITAPLAVTGYGSKRRRRKKVMLGERLRDALGTTRRSPSELRRDVLEFQRLHAPWEDDLAISAADRERWARTGIALPDGSFPITKCSGDGPSAENARRAIGRAPASKRPRVRAHIARRERALGCSGD